MKTLLLAVTALVLTTAAHANTYTYMCKVGQKSYPVTVTTPYEESGGPQGLGGGVLTWRGKTYPNVKEGEGCKANFTVSRDGTNIELCAATHGYADLTVNGAEYACQMPESARGRRR
jgi:hypothetical protein